MSKSLRVVITCLLLGGWIPVPAHAHSARANRTVAVRSGVVHGHRYAAECNRRKRRSANAGTLVGGVGGAVIGAAAMATPIGAGVGALAGHALGKSRQACSGRHSRKGV